VLGIDSLKGALAEDTPAWALYQYDEQYLVRIKWRPNGCSSIKKVLVGFGVVLKSL